MDTGTKELITKDMTMGAIMEKYPASAEIMQSYGLQCIGCHVNPYESLEAGALGHGMTEEQIQGMLNELNELTGSPTSHEKPATGTAPSEKAGLLGKSNASSQAGVDKPFLVLPKAALKLKAIMQEQGKASYGVRMQVVSGGCAGYMYGMDFEEKPAKDDEVMEFAGVKVFVDKKSYDMLKGTEVDYVESLQQSGFKFNNPNATGSCGCGKSFH